MEDRTDADGVAGGDVGDVVGPVFPVGAGADLLDDLGVDRCGPFLEGEQGALHAKVVLLVSRVVVVLVGGRWVGVDDVDGSVGVVSRFVREKSDAVDVGVEAFVMRTQGLEDLPDDVIVLVLVEGGGRFLSAGMAIGRMM